jgi:hypothetical protein
VVTPETGSTQPVCWRPLWTAPELEAVAVWADGGGLPTSGRVAFVASVSKRAAVFAECKAMYGLSRLQPARIRHVHILEQSVWRAAN